MAAPSYSAAYRRSSESSGYGHIDNGSNKHNRSDLPPLSPSPFDDRFPQPASSFTLPHSRTASASSTTSTRSNGSEQGRLPRTTSSSKWMMGDFTHDVELLLGEEGRGKSPVRGERASTPSRSSSRLGQTEWVSEEPEAGPSTPRTSSNGHRDHDTTPKGLSGRGSNDFTSRPLHTPPQILPTSSFLRTGTSSPSSASRSRMASQTSSSSALRPPSSQSQHSSSQSSSYSHEEDNSWATDLAPPDLDDELASTRSPALYENLCTSDQARPLSEFDIMAAYARSDGGSMPNSPMLPTVGVVQPASPVAPSSTDGRFEATDSQTGQTSSRELSTSTPNEALESATTPPLPATTVPSPIPSTLLQANITPSSSRSPSPAPSLSPNARPSSRTSNRSVSSPVRPPRRQASNLSLIPKSDQSQSSDSTTPSSIFPPPIPSSSTSALEDPASLSPAKSRKTNASPVPNGGGSPRSPRPPSIPEKSRRRASTLGLGLKRGHGRSESVEIELYGASSENGHGMEGTGGGSFTNPNTPLSASDFAEAYGRNDWDTSSSLGPSTAASPNLPRSSHIRDAASFDLSPSQSPNHLSSSPMEARTDSAISATSSYTGEDGDTSREEVYTDAHAGTSPNPGAMFENSGLQLDTGDHLKNVPPRSSEIDLLTPTNGPASNPVSPTAAGRSVTPKGDAKARAAAFIADLKKARQEAASPENQRNVQTEEDDTIRIETKEREGPQPTISPVAERPPPVPTQQQQSSSSSLPRPITRTSESPLPHPPQPSSRSSMLPPSRQTSHNMTHAPPPLPPLLRRRPLPMAIQASGELKKARTAGDRARIYASKINELSREKSRLNEWIEAVRNPRLAIGRASLASQPASPLKTARSFRQDASTATFAPRGDGYRAKEIHSHTFGPKDMTPSAPYPGVLSYNSIATNSTISTSGSISSNRSTLGSGLPAASAAPGTARPSFFSRSLGRRTSKREPPRETPRSNSGGSAISALPISNPSPLLYSSSSATTTAPSNLRSIGGPRMPGNLSSRASFDSRTSISSPIASSPQINSHTGSPVTSSAGHPHRASFSYGSTTSSIASSPITYSNSNEGTSSSSQDSAALSRLTDILPQANKEDLVEALKKAGGDDVLAISVYLSEEATKKGY
ncbi:hypothetical protein JCM5353_001276 [Sporobolomyces roseus]